MDPPIALSGRKDLLRQPLFHHLHTNLQTLRLHVWRLKPFARHLGVSRGVASHFSLCRRDSSRRLYQHRWSCYRHWCADRGHSVSHPSMAKIADFLFLRVKKGLSVSAVRGYRSTLTAVFKYKLPDLSSDFILRDMVRSFTLACLPTPVGPPSWDLVKVLEYLRGPSFEPLASQSLWTVTLKTLFLLSLATAKRVGELQALSHLIATRGSDIAVSYLQEFVAKTESVQNPLPHSFLVKSLCEFVGDLPEERLLCPVRAVHVYLEMTSSLAPQPRSLCVTA